MPNIYQTSAYLAARYSRRDELRKYADRLRELRVDVTSRWLEEDVALNSNMQDHPTKFHEAACAKDMEDVQRADILIFFAEDPTIGIVRGGRNVELGMAIAWDKPVYIIGEYENIFHYASQVVKHFENFDRFMDWYFYE